MSTIRQSEGSEPEETAWFSPSGGIASPLRQAPALTLAESAARQISEMIRLGELREGQRLPPERELAKTLNLSRGALREGLRTLEAVGMLKVRVGSGRFVSVSGSDDFSSGLSMWMSMQAIGDVIAVRRLLEPDAIHAIPATQLVATAQECAEIFAKMCTAFNKGQYEAATRHHSQFHLALIQYAGARIHRTLLINMVHTTETAQLEIFRTPRAGRLSIDIHAGISEALKEGDVEETAKRDADHLTSAFVYSSEDSDSQDRSNWG